MAPEEPGSKQCPTCGSWDVRWAMIEDGGQGNWCDNCKKSLKAMGVQKYEGSPFGQILYGAAIAVVSLSILLFVFWFLASAVVPFHGMRGSRSNGIALEDARNLSTCFAAHYADHQRYPLSIEELKKYCSHGIRRNVVVKFLVLNEQDYEFVIFHKKGFREYRTSHSKSGFQVREKGEKEWRTL